MDGGETSFRNGRVIVLSRDSALRAAIGRVDGRTAPVFVPTAYEAAAEILTAPAAALVLDLRLLGPRHARLLEIAREKRLEMLAVGALAAGMTAEDLSGVRLVARDDLPAALVGALGSPGGAGWQGEQADASRRPVDQGHADAAPVDEQDEGARRMREAMDAVRSEKAADRPAGEADLKAPRRTRPRGKRKATTPAGAADRPAAPGSPGALLTPEEIDALLGNQS